MEDGPSTPHRRFKEGNDDGKGSYLVGKSRPPESGKFQAGDGRRRGRRAKGTRNFDTDFQAEIERKVPVRENGAERRVSKQRAAIIRLLDNAYAKGQNSALALVFAYLRRLEDKRSQASALTVADETLIDVWLAQRAAGLQSGDPDSDSGAQSAEVPESDDQ